MRLFYSYYDFTSPAAADLNNDGVINILDLEALAKNYGATRPTTGGQ